MQRDLSLLPKIERATLSGVVATLVRKGFVLQTPRRCGSTSTYLEITDAGLKLWDELPDPIALGHAISFDGADEDDLATTRRVLRAATPRLLEPMAEQDERRL